MTEQVSVQSTLAVDRSEIDITEKAIKQVKQIKEENSILPIMHSASA